MAPPQRRPIRPTWLPYGRHEVDEDDIAVVIDVLRSDWITQGKRIEAFEAAVAEYCGAAYGVAFCNGTAALHAACLAAGLGPGDEAITTPLTFVATANAIAYCGARPALADIRPDTLNIDMGDVERQITPQTRAILGVDFAGAPAALDGLRALAARHRLVLIEDAAHALGAEYKGRKVGAIADMTVFSFHPVKHITTGEGGMVVTNDTKYAERLRILRHHGIVHPDGEPAWQYRVEELGYNYRITDIQCALGLSQLRKLDARIARRRAIAARYARALASIDGVTLPTAEPGHAWHLFVVLLNLDRLRADRDAVIRSLRGQNIGATFHYPLVHLHPLYRERFKYGEGMCPVAERIAPRLMTLPLFPTMTDDDVDDVVEALARVMAQFRR